MSHDPGNWCTFQTYPETNNPPQPAEFCENHTEPGEEFCREHLGADEPDGDPDGAYDRYVDICRSAGDLL